MISARSRYVREYRKYHRTHRRMITSSKCRPRNSAGRLGSRYNVPDQLRPHLQQNQYMDVKKAYVSFAAFNASDVCSMET
jgi:hypothetical protein